MFRFLRKKEGRKGGREEGRKGGREEGWNRSQEPTAGAWTHSSDSAGCKKEKVTHAVDSETLHCAYVPEAKSPVPSDHAQASHVGELSEK